MPESPLAASPYQVLGVAPTATDEELRRAFRRALRQTHPDTGGDPARFAAVQQAWDRIGTPAKRAAYDAAGQTRHDPVSTARAAGPARADTRARTRSYGHPGGWRRERFLTLMREWSGRGTELDDPYDPALVRSAPREIWRTLADALAEEATARNLNSLGIGFTVWHDVATDPGWPAAKIDHIVLGPTGLVAMLSEDYGGPVKARRGELIGEAVAGERPVRELAARTKRLGRALRVRFTALIVVLPDADLAESALELGTVRGIPALAVRQERLGQLLRTGVPGSVAIGGTELFDVRTRLQEGVRFV